MSVDQAYNFREINSQLSTSGLLSEEQLQSLAAENYEVVINLLPDHHEYAVTTESAIVEAQGLKYHYLPIEFDAPTLDELQQFCTLMKSAETQKKLVHCAANYRVSVFYGLYAFRHLDWSAEQARQFIAQLVDSKEYPVWHALIDDVLNNKA